MNPQINAERCSSYYGEESILSDHPKRGDRGVFLPFQHPGERD